MNEAVANLNKLLHDTRHLSLATVNQDGSPYGTWLRFVADNEYIYFDNVPNSAHIANIQRDPRVCLTILNLEDPDHSISGYVQSQAEILNGAASIRALKLLQTVGTPDPNNDIYCRIKIGKIDPNKKVKNPHRQFYFINTKEAKS